MMVAENLYFRLTLMIIAINAHKCKIKRFYFIISFCHRDISLHILQRKLQRSWLRTTDKRRCKLLMSLRDNDRRRYLKAEGICYCCCRTCSRGRAFEGLKSEIGCCYCWSWTGSCSWSVVAVEQGKLAVGVAELGC